MSSCALLRQFSCGRNRTVEKLCHHVLTFKPLHILPNAPACESRAASDRLTQGVTWSREMICRAVTYDKKTDEMRASLPIPSVVAAQAKRIAGFRPQDDGLGEYPLDEEQTREVAALLGFHPEPGRFHYCAEPYEPPEDTGLQAGEGA